MNLKEFVNPSKRYRPAPFWSWNYTIEAAEVENRVREMKRKGFGGFFIHSRPGLRTEYMSDDWMRAVRRGVETAREIEMECWLYDEDKWPSGTGGGETTQVSDDNLALALSWYEDLSSVDEDLLEHIVAYTRKGDGGAIELLSEKPENTDGLGVFVERRFTRGHFWFNGENYADLLNPDTVQAFIENTYEKYSKLFRYDFGEFLPGIFTDEPHVNRTISWYDRDEQSKFSVPWTPGFAEFFEQLHGYSPMGSLHHLLNGSDDGFKFRHDFWEAINERFIQSFTIPVSEWCHEHDLKFTGHYLYEDDFYPMTVSGGAVMPHYEYFDVPGIDHLGRNIRNPWTLKQVVSAANQLDKDRTICEIFGTSGQSLSFEDIKWIADFHFALGINYLCPHLVQYSMKGESKRDFPPTFSYHQPYWDQMRVINDYIGRCSWAVSMGESTSDVLFMVPTGSAYGLLDMSGDEGGDNMKKIENAYRALTDSLLAEHIAFDLGDERLMRRHGKADGGTLTIGKADYSTVIIPESATWKTATIDMLEEFTLEEFTGQIIIVGDIPKRIDGELSDRITQLAGRDNVTVTSDNPAEAAKAIAAKSGREVSITGEDGAEVSGILVNHRKEAGANVIFLANTDRETAKDVTVSIKAAGGVVELDPLTGRAFRYAAEFKDGATVIKTKLHKSGSKIFLIDQTQTSVAEKQQAVDEDPLVIEGPYSFQRLQDNVLTIDRCTLEIDHKKRLKNEPVWKAKKAIWEATGIDEYWGYQPWIMEKKNVRTRTNTTVLTYKFTVTNIPETIALAMESADKFTVTVNGNSIEPTPGKWYLDKRIKVLDLEGILVEGENTIRAETDFLWDTEIEDIYIFGDFAVGTEADGFPVTFEPETLNDGNWVEQGYPFYAGSMSFKLEFDLEFDDTERFEIDLSGAKACNMLATVNGTEIGSIPFNPYRADITGAMEQGKNTIEIELVGTLRNTLGPFHHTEGDGLDWTGPEQFCDEDKWTDGYSFAPYGFIDPPKLVKITNK